MNTIDFLANSPNVFIHGQENNKTNFGGILFLLFIIIMIFISLVYIITFFKNDKYDIQYSPVYLDDQKKYSLAEDEIYNPYMEFTIKLSGVKEELSERYLVRDSNQKILINGSYSEGEITYKLDRNINYLNFEIVFICQVEDCSDEMPEYTGYTFTLSTKKFEVHKQDDVPIQLIDEERELAYVPGFFTASEYSFEWNPIIFRESFGGFSNLFNSNAKDAYSNGDVELISEEELTTDTERLDENTFIKYIICINNESTGTITEFKRTRKALMDVIANICSLFITFHSLFTVLLIYYTKRYNNYQILQRIINLRINKQDNQSLTKHLSTKNIENETDNNIEMPLVDKPSDKKDSEQAIKVIDNDNDNEDDVDKLESNINLPKFYFYDFYFNNFYFNCCKKSRKQEIINIANEITFKYLSIDYIVAILMKLENLLKDYRWNNPSLNNIENNDLINRLKTIV